MFHTSEITAEEIARAMRLAPSFGMDVIATFIDGLDADNFAEEGVENQHHEMAANPLRWLADAIEETMKDV